MQLKVDQFCNLSTNAAWQAWLWRFDEAMYHELADHLRRSRGCAHNREKMVQLLEAIQSRPGGAERLFDFIRSNFPHIAVQDEPVRKHLGNGEPFRESDCRLMTFPRRAVLRNPDQAVLKAMVAERLADAPRADYEVIGDKAFIEYVPRTHAEIASNIPDKNWLIARWRAGG